MKHEAFPGEQFSNESQFQDPRLESSSGPANSSEWFGDLMSAEKSDLKDQAQALLAEQDRLQDRISELNERIDELRKDGNMGAISSIEREISDCNTLLENNANDLGYIYEEILKKQGNSTQKQGLN